MHRIRVLRIVVPILLAVLVIAVLATYKSRPKSSRPAAPSSDQAARMEGFSFSDLVGDRRRLLVEAKVGRVDDHGAFDVEDVNRVEVDREGQSPLILSAKRGAGSGEQGKRVMRLEGGVTLNDQDAGIGLTLPSVDVDQVAGEVRSVGAVRMKNAEWSGTAAAVTYSLKTEPTRLSGLVFDGPNGGHLEAQRGTLPAGSRTLTLEGAVVASQGGMTVHAERVDLVRRADGQLESITASPQVTGSALAVGGNPASFAGHELRAVWNAEGKMDSVSLSQDARLTHARGSIAAENLDAKAAPGGGFAISAATQVVASGPVGKGKGTLACDALDGTLSAAGVITGGTARGNVRFDGEGTAGEAAQARFDSLSAGGTIVLTAAPDRRARLASGRIRIVAESIVSDVKGTKLTAEGHVESTLLPPPAGAQAVASSAMFTATDAVHFVSGTLESWNSGARLLFRGDVRGWQGERTLSADEIEMIQAGEVANARGRVATRLPRVATRATSEADYVQVVADQMAYRGGAHTADYEGNVKVRQAEGWLTAPVLHAELAASGSGLREVTASGGVRFEYRAPGDREGPTTASGDGDRAVYEVPKRVLLLYGDKGPATVRNTGAKGGTTIGRVLRYDLSTGSLAVESGERDRATIRTPKE